MSNEKEDKKEPKKPDSGWDSEPTIYVVTKSKDGINNMDVIKKIKKNK